MPIRQCLHILSILCYGVAALPAIAAAPATAPVVKVIAAGDGPKKELRYQFQKGAAETLNLEMQMSMNMTMGGQPAVAMDMPAMKMTMKVQVHEILANGDAKLSMEFTEAGVAEKPGLPPEVANQMRQALKPMVGLKGTGIISTRGEAREAKFEAPPDATPQLLQSLQSAEQQLSQMASPLPKEAVGVGAKWEVASDQESNGLKLTQKISYTLKSLDEKGAAFDVAIKQSAKPQMFQGMQLLRLESTGTGTTQLDLTRLVPVDYSAKLDMSMAMSQADNKVDMNMKMNVTMKPAEH